MGKPAACDGTMQGVTQSEAAGCQKAESDAGIDSPKDTLEERREKKKKRKEREKGKGKRLKMEQQALDDKTEKTKSVEEGERKKKPSTK